MHVYTCGGMCTCVYTDVGVMYVCGGVHRLWGMCVHMGMCVGMHVSVHRCGCCVHVCSVCAHVYMCVSMHASVCTDVGVVYACAGIMYIDGVIYVCGYA